MTAEERFVETIYHDWMHFDIMEDCERDEFSYSHRNTKGDTLNPYVEDG